MAKFYRTFGKAASRAKKDKKYVIQARNGWNVVGRAKYDDNWRKHKKRMRKTWGQKGHW